MQVACEVGVLRPWVERLIEVSPACDRQLRISGGPEGCVLLRNETPCGPVMEPGEIYERLVSLVSFGLVDGFSSGLVLHAGCVMRGDTCVLIAGISGAGKTTSTAWFLGRGYDYLTDELVFVPFAGGRVRGWARPLHVKNGSFDWVRAQQRGADQRPPLRYPGGAFVMPENFAARVVEAAVPTRLLFVHYDENARTRVTALRPAQTATRLVRHLVNARNLPGHGVRALIAFCRGLQAYDVHYAHLDDLAVRLDL